MAGPFAKLLSIVIATAALLAPSLASAQETAPASLAAPPPAFSTRVEDGAEALAQDAAAYAQAQDVSLDEAERRLRAQQETVALTDQLQVQYRDRLAGISIEHQPAFRIVVLLTGSDPVPGQVVQAGGMAVPIVFQTGAAATRVQLDAAIAQHQAEIRAALPHPPGMGVDLRTGELVVVVAGADADLFGADQLREQFAALTGVPVRIRAIDRPALDMMAEGRAAEGGLAGSGAVEGGARVVGVDPADGRRYACTTGFVVTDGARTGIATAAHCPDNLSYIDPAGGQVPLTFAGQWGWGNQDVQLNLSDQALAPLFFADTAKTLARPVTGHESRLSTRAGDMVCHRGERTGYSCAPVELVDFAPAGDLCGGACLPTWVSVAGPHCQGGDSGAPVFIGTTALGLVKGGSYRGDGGCAFYFYMSVDYLPTGWSLLEQAPAAMPLLPPPTVAPGNVGG